MKDVILFIGGGILGIMVGVSFMVNFDPNIEIGVAVKAERRQREAGWMPLKDMKLITREWCEEIK